MLLAFVGMLRCPQVPPRHIRCRGERLFSRATAAIYVMMPAKIHTAQEPRSTAPQIRTTHFPKSPRTTAGRADNACYAVFAEEIGEGRRTPPQTMAVYGRAARRRHMLYLRFIRRSRCEPRQPRRGRLWLINSGETAAAHV